MIPIARPLFDEDEINAVKAVLESGFVVQGKKVDGKRLELFVYDDLFGKEELEKRGLRWIKPEDADLVFDCFDLKMERLE